MISPWFYNKKEQYFQLKTGLASPGDIIKNFVTDARSVPVIITTISHSAVQLVIRLEPVICAGLRQHLEVQLASYNYLNYLKTTVEIYVMDNAEGSAQTIYDNVD